MKRALEASPSEMGTAPDAAKPPKIRCFVAIHLPEPVLVAAIKFQEELRALDERVAVRFTEREQMHLTLKFLGHIPAEFLEPLCKGLGSAADTDSALELSLGEFGAFPSLRRPRVLWLGFGGNVEALAALQAKVEGVSAEWSAHEEDREFRPHLTLGRLRDPRSPEGRRLGDKLFDLRFPGAGPWTVKEFSLMQSHLSPKGATYTELQKFVLR